MAILDRVTTEFSGLPGAPYFNQLYFENTATPGPSASVATVLQFWQSFADNLNDGMDAVVHGVVEQIESTTGTLVGITDVGDESVTFTATDTALPLATQGLIHLHTGQIVSGRLLRGRVFVPGWGEDASAAGRPVAATVGHLNSGGALLAGTGCVIYSPTHRVFHTVESASAWSEWAVLRSRRP